MESTNATTTAAVKADASSIALPKASEMDLALNDLKEKLLSTTTSSSAEKAIAGEAAASEQWKIVCLQCLSYGTDYNLPRESKAATASPASSEPKKTVLKLKMRALKTVQLFVGALACYDDNNIKNDTNTQEEKQGEQQLKATQEQHQRCYDAPRAILADCIWIVGCALQPPPLPAPGNDSAIDGGSETEESLHALVDIVKALAGQGPQQVSSKVANTSALAKTSATATITKPKIVIPIVTLLTVLEPYLLGMANLVSSEEMMAKKFRRINTDFFYRQRKFNLLAEESEGYAKVLSLLYSLPPTPEDQQQQNDTSMQDITNNKHNATDENDDTTVVDELVLSRIRELVGAFDLDPNRVLDLILDSMEFELDTLCEAHILASTTATSPATKTTAKPKASNTAPAMIQGRRQQQGSNNTGTAATNSNLGNVNFMRMPINRTIQILLKTLDTFKKSSIPHLLAFKLGRLCQQQEATQQRANAITSIHRLTSFLAIQGYVIIKNDIWNLLSPDLAIMVQQSKAAVKAYANRIDSLGVVKLNSGSSNSSTAASATPGAAAANGSSNIAAGATPAMNGTLGNGMSSNGGVANSSTLTAVSSTNKSNDNNSNANSNQRLHLIHALLSFGAWPIAFTLLQELTAYGIDSILLFPKLGDMICSILHTVIEEPYMNLKSPHMPPHNLFSSHGSKKDLSNNSNGSSSGDINGLLVAAAKVHPHLLPISISLTDLPTVISEPVKYLGANAVCSTMCMIGSDPVLYGKLCRLFNVLLSDITMNQSGGKNEETKNDEEIMMEVLSSNDTKLWTILEEFIVPSLSMFPSNPSLCSELWNCLDQLPYPLRYRLYDTWRDGSHVINTNTTNKSTVAATTSKSERSAISSMALRVGIMGVADKPLERIQTEIQTGIEARYVLKRVSKENFRDMGKRLAKAAHSQPLIVFAIVFGQIESYDNLIGLMVDSFKNLTRLSLDTMGYCVLQILGGGGRDGDVIHRDKMKADGINATQWMLSLEQFTGSFWKKFPEVELRGILNFLISRLQAGETAELGVLKSLLSTAGGADSGAGGGSTQLSRVQLEGRAGSQLLKRETSSFGIVDKVNKKTAKKLRDVLLQRDIGLPMLVLLSQVRSKVLYDDGKSKKIIIKLLGFRRDHCHEVLGLLVPFLTIPPEDEQEESNILLKYAELLPGSLKELVEVYKLENAMVWMLARPLVRAAFVAAMKIRDELEEEDAGEVAKSEIDQMKAIEKAMPEALLPWMPSSSIFCKDVLSESIRNTTGSITPVLFESFWSHNLYDIYNPRTRYEIEITRLKKEAERLLGLQKREEQQQQQQQRHRLNNHHHNNSIADVPPPLFTKNDEQDLDRVKKHAEMLSKEQIQQTTHCRMVYKFMEQRRESFFRSIPDTMDASLFDSNTEAFLTKCIYSRCLLSPEDAMYCARFVNMLQRIDAPRFFILQYMDRLLKVIVAALFCVTEQEVGNLGVLLHETWMTLSGWRYESIKYQNEVKRKERSHIDNPKEETTHESYAILYNTWHTSLKSALIGCLKSAEYIHQRSALTVLTAIVRIYPTRPQDGESILEHLKPLQDDSLRPDIRAMASACAAQLLKARDDGVWKELDQRALKQIMIAEQAKKDEIMKERQQRAADMAKESEDYTRKYGTDSKLWSGRRTGQNRSPLNPSAQNYSPASSLDQQQRPRDPRGDPRHRSGENRDRDGSIRHTVNAPIDSRRISGSGGDQHWDRNDGRVAISLSGSTVTAAPAAAAMGRIPANSRALPSSTLPTSMGLEGRFLPRGGGGGSGGGGSDEVYYKRGRSPDGRGGGSSHDVDGRAGSTEPVSKRGRLSDRSERSLRSSAGGSSGGGESRSGSAMRHHSHRNRRS